MSRGRLNRSGFTLIEAAVVSVLISLLVVLLSTAWVGLGQPSADALVRCRLLQEAQMATLSLAKDLGGVVPAKAANPRTFDPPEKNTDGELLNVTSPDGSQLQIEFLDSTKNITYRRSTEEDNVGENRLLRINGANRFVVADHIEDMDVVVGTDVEIELTFSFRAYRGSNLKTHYRLIFKKTLL
jgi:hypothetical protein